MFQGLLHHLFLELVKHVSSVIAREGAYSIEFSVGSHHSTLSLCFGRASVWCACPCYIVEGMFRPHKVILISFHHCWVRFRVTQQSSAAAVQMPTL